MRLETHVLPIAVCKSCRIRHSPNSGTVRRFPVLPTPCAKAAKSVAFCDSLPVFALVCFFAFDTGGLGLWQPLQPWFVKETAFFFAKAQNLRIRRSRILGIVCRFSPWYAFLPLIPAVWGFGLGLLGGQGFIGAKASLDPLCRALWHRASFWQPLQTRSSKGTAFFLERHKSEKLQNLITI